MRLHEIYELAIESGIAADPRDRAEIEKQMTKKKQAYDKLEADQKEFFDQERLRNPYSDTRILVGEPDFKVNGLIVGIDMEVGEVVLADRLREKGAPIDLILAHHPEGKALAALADVMRMQADIWALRGVPINVGDSLIGGRMREISRRLSPVNHSRAVDAARQLGLAMMCVHTPSDNMVNRFVQDFLDKSGADTPGEILKQLRTIPEYAQAARNGSGPFLLVGESDSRAGRVHVDFTGGTEGPKEAISKLADAGVGTIVGMHMDDKLREEAEKANLNVVIAGHISSDNLGINLFLDKLEERGLQITTTSGMHRVSRTSK